MKAITIWQPWASLIACGAKKFETRSWATKYRGPIAIHAATKDSKAQFKGLPNHIQMAISSALFLDHTCWDNLPFGSVIAIAELVECWNIKYNPGPLNIGATVPVGGELGVPKKHPDFSRVIIPTPQELLFGDWTPGRYAWELTNIKILDKPVPAKGKQRLWDWHKLS